MLWHILSNINRLRYQYRYPGITIGHHVSLSHDSCFGDGTVIGDFVTVKSSSFGQCANVVDKSTVVDSHCADNVKLVDAHLHSSKIARNVAIYNGCRVSDVSVGQYSYFALGSLVSMASFGRFCSVGPNLLCGHGNHPSRFISTNPVFFSTFKQCGITFTDEGHFKEREKIEIGNDVWIGANVFIRDGIRVGDGAIIAAGSVVVKDVSDYAIVGGAPAKTIRYRFEQETIEKLQKIKWWYWPEEKLRMAQPHFITEDLTGFFDWVASNHDGESSTF